MLSCRPENTQPRDELGLHTRAVFTIMSALIWLFTGWGAFPSSLQTLRFPKLKTCEIVLLNRLRNKHTDLWSDLPMFTECCCGDRIWTQCLAYPCEQQKEQKEPFRFIARIWSTARLQSSRRHKRPQSKCTVTTTRVFMSRRTMHPSLSNTVLH